MITNHKCKMITSDKSGSSPPPELRSRQQHQHLTAPPQLTFQQHEDSHQTIQPQQISSHNQTTARHTDEAERMKTLMARCFHMARVPHEWNYSHPNPLAGVTCCNEYDYSNRSVNKSKAQEKSRTDLIQSMKGKC